MSHLLLELLKFVPLLLIGAVVVCLGLDFYRYRDRKEPPPGWEIVKAEDGTYGAREIGSTYVTTKWGRERKLDRQGAMKAAWELCESNKQDAEKAEKWRKAKKENAKLSD